MKLHFLGANRQVTGSRYLLETSEFKLLVDCGLFQEREFQDRNWETCPIPPNQIDAVVLTHAHVDHVGLLPRLVRRGFDGIVYATEPTVDLADIILNDAAKIQMEDIKYKEKRHRKQNKKSPFPYEPLFNDEDAKKTLGMILGVPYRTPKQIHENIDVEFFDAGHILGSSSLLFTIKLPSGEQRQLVFSGDIGQQNKPIIRDPQPVGVADYLVIESTYGDRDHPDGGDIEIQLENIINETMKQGGKLIIPTFAVERAQELMYYIGKLTHSHRIPAVPVYLDSPMAVDATETFREHLDSFDKETTEMIQANVPPLRFPNLHLVRSTRDSKAINNDNRPAIIMSTSGMCTAGRIKHHLRNNISNKRNTILFVGFQSHGTLGRRILDGQQEVRIHGHEYKVKARVAQIFGFSGHADRSALLTWARAFSQPPRTTFITHGEEDAALHFAKQLQDQLGWTAEVPHYQQTVTLT